jgi:hypothetical protein
VVVLLGPPEAVLEARELLAPCGDVMC